MPCNTITTVSVQFKNGHLSTMKAALEKEGYKVTISGESLIGYLNGYNNRQTNVSYDRSSGRLTVADLEVAKKVKTSYTLELARREVAKLGYGWKVSTVGNKIHVSQ